MRYNFGMQTTRRNILQRLNQSPPQSAMELARGLGMTVPNIRYHLRILVESGDVIATSELKAIGRGRPTTLYSSALTSRPESRDHFVRSLWDELMGERHTKQRRRRKEKLARRLMGGRVETASNGPLPQRLSQAVRAMNAAGYLARWEARPEAPVIVLERCPFDGLYPTIPELCEVDCTILEYALGLPVEQIAAREPIGGKGSACKFRLPFGGKPPTLR